MVREGSMVYCAGPPLAVTRASRASSYFYCLEGKLRRMKFQERVFGGAYMQMSRWRASTIFGRLSRVDLTQMILLSLDFFYCLETIVL